ncbi:hypothetical protein OEZ86_000722 [Tetradesmus obliquus]|nr:hypothetical protein OEZ86_000722 [Tetradesmus obliquus]
MSSSHPDQRLRSDQADGSIIAELYENGDKSHRKGEYVPERYPTNREVASAIEKQVATSVENYRNYRHVTWYTLFIVLYMLVLYFQASSFKSGEVVATLKAALLPQGTTSTTMTFSSEDQVLAFLGNQIIRPVWKDPVCGDSRCEAPWEFPAWGPFGCQADCGLNPNTTKVIVALSADFSGHPSISPATLRGQVSWNLCLNDTLRARRGMSPLCWFAEDQVFTEVIETQIKAVYLVDGDWYVKLDGDLAGRVTGAVYDASQGDDTLVSIPVSPTWEACKLKRRRPAASTGRRLLSEFTVARNAAGEAGDKALQQAMAAAANKHAQQDSTEQPVHLEL